MNGSNDVIFYVKFDFYLTIFPVLSMDMNRLVFVSIKPNNNSQVLKNLWHLKLSLLN